MVEEHGTTDPAGNNSLTIKAYVRLKERLLASIERMSASEPSCVSPCGELREKLETNAFNLVVVGQFKRGKTYFINALMGTEILPVAVVPLTSIVTILKYGESLRVQVFFNDGTVTEIEPAGISEYVTETGNPRNIRNVREVHITYPSSYLKDGVRLIDTPGVGSIYLHNTDVAYQYLPKSDAAIFLLSVDQPVSRAELDFLRDVREYSDRIFFLLNKIDYLSEEEVDQSIVFSRGAVTDAMGSEVRIFPVSAKLALRGKQEGSDQLIAKSGLKAFSEVLERFLLLEKGKVLLLSVIHNLLRNLSQGQLELELEQRSLETPLEELERKLKAVESKKNQILAEKENLDILLDGEVNRLVKTVLDEDLAVFKGEFMPQMEEGLDAFYEEKKDLSLRELSDALEGYVVREVEKAFTAWHRIEEDKVAEALESICDRFATRINDIVDDLLTFSSELFSISFEVVKAESVWTHESGFYYKLKDEPVGLDMLTASLTQVLPGYISKRFEKIKAYVFKIANRMIYNKRKQHMLETIDMQAGRIRYDFIHRLQKGKLGFRKGMLTRIEETVEGITRAIQKGLDERTRGEKELEERLATLRKRLEDVEQIRLELLSIRETVQEM